MQFKNIWSRLIIIQFQQPNNNMQVIMLKYCCLRIVQRGKMSRMLHLHLDYTFAMESRFCNVLVSTPINLLIDILMSSARACIKSHKRMWRLVRFKLQANTHIPESKKIFIWVFPDEVSKNKIIDGIELACHMTLVNKQGDISMQIILIHTGSINTSI